MNDMNDTINTTPEEIQAGEAARARLFKSRPGPVFSGRRSFFERWAPLDLRVFASLIRRTIAREREEFPYRGFADRFAFRAARDKRRNRVRQRVLAECKVVDVRNDAGKTRTYFELENGQIVRYDRHAPVEPSIPTWIVSRAFHHDRMNNGQRRRAVRRNPNAVLRAKFPEVRAFADKRDTAAAAAGA